MKMNLLRETLEVLEEFGKSPADVQWVGNHKAAGTWDDFLKFADFEYDAGYGGAEVNEALKVVGADWWLERGEYDGKEWWEFKTIPERPALKELRADDLRA